jgi:hypothetical protein
MNLDRPSRNPLLMTLALAASTLVAGVAQAQTTVVYTLDDVWMIPDISRPWDTTERQMTGTFEWTYTEGDFENGTGMFTEFDLPWWNEAAEPWLDENIQPDSIEITMQGNFHDLGVDVSLKFDAPFSPDAPSDLDLVLSQFQIEVGVIYQGHFVSGRVVPASPPDCTPDLNGDGVLDFFDVAAFLDAFANEDPAADFTGDGVYDFFDVAGFLDAFAAGCP